jgi:hypothetical protein
MVIKLIMSSVIKYLFEINLSIKYSYICMGAKYV